mmetsp:Transcript_17675/g.28625  ORF Transcript_17675/g.28625 Transcript_17675/m.28625 type:complete len:597 (-) Transcript_17675:1352-3142(-)
MKAFVLLVLLAVLKCFAWREWDYSTETTDEWEDIWGYSEGPRLRRGHSLVIHKDQGRIILFGGRDNNILRAHNPKTYEVVEINGTLEFNNYDQNPVKECTAESSNTTGLEYSFTSTSQEKTANNCSNFAVVGLFYNDVWEYDLDCTRYGDGPCENRGWKVLHAGAKDGGCKYYLGKKICTVPTERWQHGSAVFNDSLVVVYGGYGPACEDYCDDLWLFDLRDNTWTEVYPPGTLSGSEALPGKRWRFSALGDGAAFWVFGGHRLWHGFASDNSAANDWGSTAELPTGGYLNDLWRFDRPLLAADERVPLLTDDFGNWTRLMPKKVCEADAEGTVTCADGPWPSARASHAAALDAASGGLWVHGGYRTYFPYLWTHGPGSLGGTSAAGASGFVPYPTYPFFLDDLWFFNFTDETWTEVTPSGDVKPDARMDHSMVKAGDKLILYGGYGDNYYFDETWQFDLATSTWLEKTSFVWPVYPENCTDDLAYIAANNCSEFKWRKDLEWEDEHYANPADRYALRRAWALKAYSDLDFYYPDESYGAFYGTLDKGEAFHADRQLASLYEGMPMGKYQAVAPRQYYTTFQYFYNGSSSATVYQR